MSTVLFRNFRQLVCAGAPGSVLRDVDLCARDGMITAIGPQLPLTDVDEVVDCGGLTAYPGLVNTHHHFFQALVRNLPGLDWTTLSLLEWLDTIYPIFARLDEDCIYHASLISLADLLKHGCTTAFDHQYNFNSNMGSRVVDRQFEAAALLGARLHVGRGCNTLPMSAGSTIPDAMLETTDAFLADCERLIGAFHNPAPGAMAQVVVAPCQPVNSLPETFPEAAALARRHGVRLHTHLSEGENAAMLDRFGMRSLDWCESVGFVGPDVWFAHGWEFTPPEIARLAATGTGVAHCPAPVFLVGAEVTDLPAMVAADMTVGMGVDGQASNDSSNLAECMRLAYLLQCLNARHNPLPAPPPERYLHMATAGGAACLGRTDIGELAVGKAADFFCADLNGLDYAGADSDPLSLPAKVGFAGPAAMTVVHGRVVWRDGEFPGLDETQLRSAADALLREKLDGHLAPLRTPG
ncbi:amidohydrolase [Mangrovimicrobium sediminis]|uniref:Amidohydrolase n=1 Tax=Mangrovimicrobium sediminis TaxID=2562682 RepID=A0A4Z0M5D5_9GAMM|nr:amidohydrolase family protein [Haliea sp. SAOS-164]TGD74630.1 amidohydrolase [Haliea sp. SAOS-164]